MSESPLYDAEAHLPIKGGLNVSVKGLRPSTVSKRSRARRSINREKAQIAANAYCLMQYATGYSAGISYPLSLAGRRLWVVPVLLTSPGYGVVGAVGVVAVDAESGKVVNGTSKSEVVAAAKRLTEGKRDDLEAAFHQARAS
jgi:hypothetical protein